MRLFSLDERLTVCASLVREGARLADVGTDHAYLPVWLLNSGKITFAIASDINEKPLLRAKATAEKYSAQNIELRLGSGVSVLTPEDGISDIVIAGMGGEVIADILSQSELVKNTEINLILQPMTKSCELVSWLCENGFEIKSQKALTAKGKSYTVILASFAGRSTHPTEVFRIVGKLDLTDGESVKYINKQIRNLENKSRSDHSLKALVKELRLLLGEEN